MYIIYVLVFYFTGMLTYITDCSQCLECPEGWQEPDICNNTAITIACPDPNNVSV